MVERAGREAKLAFKAHPLMLPHACGYALANKRHDTRSPTDLPRPQEHPAYRALHRAFADGLKISGEASLEAAFWSEVAPTG